LFISEIAIVGNERNNITKNIHEVVTELGYRIVSPIIADVIIAIGSAEFAIKYVKGLKRRRKPVLILISEDGSYVIPLLKEEKGGSMLGGLISDLLGAELVLTSYSSQNALYTIDEFIWTNALKAINPRKKKIINDKLGQGENISIFNENKCLELKLDESYKAVKNPDDADIIITKRNEKNKFDGGKLLLEPREVLFPIWFTASTPAETIVYSIFTTMKSIFLFEKRVDKIFVPSFAKQEVIAQLASVLRSNVCKLDVESYVANEKDYMTICEEILRRKGGKVLLNPTKRAMGVITCLGIR